MAPILWFIWSLRLGFRLQVLGAEARVILRAVSEYSSKAGLDIQAKL